jgi:nucleoid DNA-binding protein
MTRRELARELAERCGISERQARKALNAILATIVEAFQSAGTPLYTIEHRADGHYYQVPIRGITLRRNAIEIRGFGRFFSESRRKPSFYSAIYQREVRERRSIQVRFRPSQDLRELVDGERDASHHPKPGTPPRRTVGRE